MRLTDRLLLRLSRRELSRNRPFKDLPKGESCYLFGNGVSLKSMDLRRFSDRLSIGCNSLFIHKDFASLDCRYYQIPGPFLFYRYRNYYGRRQRNCMGDLYREKIGEYPQTRFFTSLSNRFGVRGSRVHYTHHFGCREWQLDQCDLAGTFSF